MAATATTAAAIVNFTVLFISGSLPHWPPGGAVLWSRVEPHDQAVEDAVRRRLDLSGAQPRPHDAGRIAIGAHRAASRGTGRASASSAARSSRIA